MINLSKRKQSLTFFLTGCFLFAQSFAHTETAPRWEFAGWVGGGCYPNVEFDPNVKNRVYLTSDVAGIWRSDDLGDHWYFINKGLDNLGVACLAIAPSDSEVLYAGTKAGLSRSKNAGQTWELCDTLRGKITFLRPHTYRSVAVSRQDPGRVVIGTSHGEVFYSEDFGAHWQTLGLKERPFDDAYPITVVRWGIDQSVLYAGSKGGLLLYSFTSDQWQKIEGSPSGITDFLNSKNTPANIYAAGQRSLFISNDNGKTWFSSKPIEEGVIYRIALIETEQSSRIVAAWNKDWNGGIISSMDEGRSWSVADSNVRPDVHANPTRIWAGIHGRNNALKGDPFDPDVIMFTDWWGVWRSDDGGKSWKEKIIGAPNVVGSDVVVSKEGVIYAAAMDNGLLKSLDGGKHYAPLFPAKGYHPEINGHVWRVLVPDADTVIATSSPWNEDINQVIISRDGGMSFKRVRSGLPAKRPKVNTMWSEGYPRALAIDPIDPDRLYLGIDGDDGGGFFVSKDGGRHWQHPKFQPGSKRIYNALAVDPTNPHRLFWGSFGNNGGIYVSENQGSSWKLVFHEMNKIFDIAIDENGTIYASGEKDGACLYFSQDHGNTWQFLKKFSDNGSAEALCMIPGRPNRIALSSVQWHERAGGTIHLSEDKGKSWTDITGDLPDGLGAAAMSFNPHDSCLYLVRYAGSVYKFKIEQ